MDKYRHRISFRLEKRKDKNGNLPEEMPIDVNDDLLARFELFLIGKGLSNNYTHQSMKTIKGFFNWATKKGMNRNMAYQAYSQRFHDETKSDSTINLYALTDEELTAILTFPTSRSAIDRARDIFVFACYTGLRFSDVISLRWSNINGDILDVVSKKTNHRQRFALASEAMHNIQNLLMRKTPCTFPPYPIRNTTRILPCSLISVVILKPEPTISNASRQTS